ncbi:hypothetical protein EG831_05525 [bacterium]|nr:hypothetical protein [bacterium]
MSPEILAEITAAVADNADVTSLRGSFPNIHFTACSDDDVSPRVAPVASAGDYRLYLITGASGHCIEFTPDLAAATGVVVALVDAAD